MGFKVFVYGGSRGFHGVQGTGSFRGYKRFQEGLQGVQERLKDQVIGCFKQVIEDSRSFKGFKWVLGSEEFKRSLGGSKKGSGGFKEVKI